MKTFLGILLVLIGAILTFSGDGLASFGNVPPPSAGTLVLLGSGMVGLALWGKRKVRRQR